METEKIAFSIEFTEDELQEFAESNCDRQLTDIELHRLKNYWWECEDLCDMRNNIMYAAANYILTTTKSTDWSEVDAEYQKELNSKNKL